MASTTTATVAAAKRPNLFNFFSAPEMATAKKVKPPRKSINYHSTPANEACPRSWKNYFTKLSASLCRRI